MDVLYSSQPAFLLKAPFLPCTVILDWARGDTRRRPRALPCSCPTPAAVPPYPTRS